MFADRLPEVWARIVCGFMLPLILETTPLIAESGTVIRIKSANFAIFCGLDVQ